MALGHHRLGRRPQLLHELHPSRFFRRFSLHLTPTFGRPAIVTSNCEVLLDTLAMLATVTRSDGAIDNLAYGFSSLEI